MEFEIINQFCTLSEKMSYLLFSKYYRNKKKIANGNWLDSNSRTYVELMFNFDLDIFKIIAFK